MEIRDIVSTAVKQAQVETSRSSAIGGQLHRERSRSFVEHLRQCLVAESSQDTGVEGFSRHKGAKTLHFGMNEFLFDVAVLKFDTVNSGRSNKDLFYITKAIWLVESELAPDKREALYDFNKLVIARSENLLFVGPTLKSDRELSDYLRVLASAAAHCAGNLYLALIPRPADWKADVADSVMVYRWSAGDKAWIEN